MSVMGENNIAVHEKKKETLVNRENLHLCE